MNYQPKTSATSFLNFAAIVSLIGGIITGLAFGSQTFGGDFFSVASTWVGWAFFACGFAGFALLAALAVIVDRLTGIRYMIGLQVADKLPTPDKSASQIVRGPLDILRPGTGAE